MYTVQCTVYSVQCTGCTWMLPALHIIYQQGQFWRKVLEEHPLWEGGGLVWCEPEDHPFFWSIYPAKCTFVYSSISSNHAVAKSLGRHGIESIPSPNQQRRPFPSRLSDSSSMAVILRFWKEERRVLELAHCSSPRDIVRRFVGHQMISLDICNIRLDDATFDFFPLTITFLWRT